MTGNDWVAVLAGTVAVLGAVGGLVGTIVSVLTKSRQEKQANAIKEYQDIVETMRKDHAADKEDFKRQIAVALGQIEQKQEAISELYDLQTDCEIGHAELYGWAQAAYQFMLRQNVRLTAQGQPLEVVPELPPPRQRKSTRAGYILRRAEQNTKISVANAKEAMGENPTKETKT